jgi:hypothetical protein
MPERKLKRDKKRKERLIKRDSKKNEIYDHQTSFLSLIYINLFDFFYSQDQFVSLLLVLELYRNSQIVVICLRKYNFTNTYFPVMLFLLIQNKRLY